MRVVPSTVQLLLTNLDPTVQLLLRTLDQRIVLALRRAFFVQAVRIAVQVLLRRLCCHAWARRTADSGLAMPPRLLARGALLGPWARGWASDIHENSEHSQNITIWVQKNTV